MRLGHQGVHVSDGQALSAHQRRNYRSHEQGYRQTPRNPSAICQGAVTYTEILGTATNTKILVIEIILDFIQFKLFVMLICHNVILLQHDTSIVSCIVYWKFSHFGLHYLYSSTKYILRGNMLDGINSIFAFLFYAFVGNGF